MIHAQSVKQKAYGYSMIKPNIAINHRTFGAGLKTATRFFAGYGGRYMSFES